MEASDRERLEQLLANVNNLDELAELFGLLSKESRAASESNEGTASDYHAGRRDAWASAATMLRIRFALDKK